MFRVTTKTAVGIGAACAALLAAPPAMAAVEAETGYVFNTFSFLFSGALVMWMAAGFTMLEAGLVRSKNTVEILTKNVALFATACTMYMVCGYAIMYGGDLFLSGIAGGDTLVEDALAASAENGFGGDSVTIVQAQRRNHV